MKPHPISELLPPMSDDELKKLVADIGAHGLHQPIVVYQGQILDGRHRFTACAAAGVKPRFTEFNGTEAEAVQFVYSANLARRQLTKSQLAMAGAKLKAWYADRAKARQLEAGKRGGQAKHGKSWVMENLPQPIDGGRGAARDHAAKAIGVCGKSIDTAEKVMRKAAPEILQLVQAGYMSLNEAAKAAELSKDLQKRIAAQPTKRTRQGELNRVLAKSNACKRGRVTLSQRVQPADAPGSPLVRALLSRLELLTNEIERADLTPQKFAEQFVSEFDWKEPLLVRRLAYVSKAVEMVSTLSVISQRARREAA